LLDHKILASKDTANESASRIFRKNDIRYSITVFDHVVQRVGRGPVIAWERILNDPNGQYDSEAVALAALGIGALRAAKVVEGSNPVWMRVALNGERSMSVKLQKAATEAATIMLKDIAGLKGLLKSRRVRILNEDIRSWAPRAASVDIVITSPPYLNRLDYVINHLGPLSLFGGLMGFDLENIRRGMIGTTKIISKKDESNEWSPLCRKTLSGIAEHPSYASATYYYWNFHQYFSDMYSVFRKLSRVCRPGAVGMLVAQNSFYKEMEIKLPEILIEIADACKISARIVREEVVRMHMGRFSPRQFAGKELKEAVLFLNF
jgi:hypothetical protein